jgi:hypothetical protein
MLQSLSVEVDPQFLGWADLAGLILYTFFDIMEHIGSEFE